MEQPPPASLTRYLGAIESSLRDVVEQATGPLADAARYSLGWVDEMGEPSTVGAKRLRPTFLMLSHDACGGTEPAAALRAAAAIELLHVFSLVHDDLEDRDIQRHGHATAWRHYGDAQAINLGDHLFTLAVSTILVASNDVSASHAMAMTLLEATAEMIEGQWADVAAESTGFDSRDAYLEMVRRKTGALVGAAMAIGAQAAGRHEVAESLRDWGASLGLAFQLRDDYLGTWGDPATTGKSNSSDIARRKWSLPVVLGMEHDAAAKVIRHEYAGGETPDVDAVREALEAAGCHEATAQLARDYALRVRQSVAELPLELSARTELAELADYVVERSR